MAQQPKTAPSTVIAKKLRNCDPAIRVYVRHIESENRKLNTRIAKLEGRHFTDRSRIAALEKELETEAKKERVPVQVVSYAKNSPRRNEQDH